MPHVALSVKHYLPIIMRDWYDCVKWCNARSEMEHRSPCYYTTSAKNMIYKSGWTNIGSECVNWTNNGYRLPTEAEWEKVARGGGVNMRFPWTDYTNRISHAKANYEGKAGTYDYDLSTGYHPAYTNGTTPYTSPAGSFTPNGFGAYDMAGNVWEWCWDWYDSGYYTNSPSTDPKGPATTPFIALRVLRGGAWYNDAAAARVANRYFTGPAIGYNFFGFRCVRRGR